MKKLKKVKMTLQDSIEAYAGVCNCSIKCYCSYCTSPDSGVVATPPENDANYSDTVFHSLSIVNTHWSWA